MTLRVCQYCGLAYESAMHHDCPRKKQTMSDERTNDYAASLRQQAFWIRTSISDVCDPFDLGDVDTDELDKAANELDRLSTALAAAEGDISALWHFATCPFDVCVRCAEDVPKIKAIKERQPKC